MRAEQSVGNLESYRWSPTFVAVGKARVPARPRPLSPLHTNHVTGKCLTYGPNLSFGITPEQIFQLIAGLGLV
jgi:hypothetical protein